MWASQWKITIGRPRKTSSLAGWYFPSFETRRIIALGSARIAIVRGKNYSLITRPLLPYAGPWLHFYGTDDLGPASFSLFTRSDNNLSCRIVDVASSRFLLPFYEQFVTIRECYTSISGNCTMAIKLSNFLLRNSEARVDENLNAVA